MACSLSIVLRAIKDRRSVRKYLPKDLPYSLIQKVLEAATWSPSAHNAQPWRFIVIRKTEIKQRLAEAMADEWDKDLREDGLPLQERERLTKASIERFTQSPVLIVACLTMEDMDAYPDERRQKVEYVMAVQSAAASIQNLLLAAHAEGLGACWFCAPLFCPERVREVLGAPSNIEPQALITLGYPAESPVSPPRKPLKNLAHQNRWGHSG